MKTNFSFLTIAILLIAGCGNKMLKEAENEKAISQDDHRAANDRVQKLTDETIAEIDEILKVKEAEILSV